MKAVFVWWAHLPDQPFRVLTYMALTAKDDDDPPRFWGGRESLALALGRMAPHTEKDFRAVGRALTCLRTAGAIATDQHSSGHRRANYGIRIQPPQDGERPVAVDSQDGERPVVTGRLVEDSQDGERPGHRTVSDRTQDGDRPPKDVKEPQGLNQGTTTHPSSSPQGDARECASCGHDRFAADGECLNCLAVA